MLIALVSGNNLSVCTGSLIGSRITSKKVGILIAILGFSLGLILEGSFLKKGVEALLPNTNETNIIWLFIIAIAAFVIAHNFRVPLSLTIVFTSMLAGIGLGVTGHINLAFIALIAFFWIAIPLLSFAILPPLLKAFSKNLERGNLWRKVKELKLLLIVVAFFTSFTLGANTIGLIYASVPTRGIAKLGISLLAIVIGSVSLSQGELRRIGYDVLPLRYLNALLAQLVSAIEVEIATLFGVPLSNTQTFTASLYGAGLGYKARLIRAKPAKVILGIWLTSAIASFLIGLAIARI